jgi:hypothetical protein
MAAPVRVARRRISSGSGTSLRAVDGGASWPRVARLTHQKRTSSQAAASKDAGREPEIQRSKGSVTDPMAGVSQVANPHLMRAQALGLAGWRIGGGRHRERVPPARILSRPPHRSSASTS